MINTQGSLLSGRNLERRFGGLLAVSELDIDLYPGEILGLIGPNGAGKSTTFNILSGFYRPTGGELHVLGEACTGSSPTKISRRGLVRTFQHGSLMPSMTVRDNILLGTMHQLSGRRRRKRVSRAEETAEMLGLSNYLQEIAGTLPHGLQRLVSIGIAFATRPKILCLDEPLTGLNYTEASSALQVLEKIRSDFNCSILLVEHNMKAAMKICDRMVVLHHGKPIATGIPEDIRANDEVISIYLGKRDDT